MTICYLTDGPPSTLTGGSRKLYDQVEFLSKAGLPVTASMSPEPQPDDLIVFSEIRGSQIRERWPGIARVVMNQNGHYMGVGQSNHWFLNTPELKAVLCVSAHAERLTNEAFPDIPCPVIRWYSSVVGRPGGDIDFHCGPWPRKRQVCYFARKRGDIGAAVRQQLDGFNGWSFQPLDGMSDQGIADTMAESGIFLSLSEREGWPGPLAEGIASGCKAIGFTGGGGDEFADHMTVVSDGDTAALIAAVRDAMDSDFDRFADECSANSKWILTTYSREAEIAGLVGIMGDLL